jgi:hypothetical protein
MEPRDGVARVMMTPTTLSASEILTNPARSNWRANPVMMTETVNITAPFTR